MGATGASPLPLAARAGHTKIVGALLVAGASPDIGPADGSALQHALLVGHTDEVGPLLAAGVSPDVVTPTGVFPLHVASTAGCERAVKLLRRRGRR